MRIFPLAAFFATTLVSQAAHISAAAGQENGQRKNFWSGNWSLTVGVEGYFHPRYEGADSLLFTPAPLISLARQGETARLRSRNDNISFAFIDRRNFRAGVAGKFLWGRDGDASDDLKGLDEVKWGGEAGAFAEYYPIEWLRLRGEVRQGIRSHDGIVFDAAADAFTNVTPTIRVSGGPRLSFATADYFDAYYGVSESESKASGLGAYDPGGGLKSLGVGGAVTWKTTDKVLTSFFAEYSSLQGPAAKSSLVRQRGSRNQFTVGMAMTYRFDFTLD